MAWRKNMHFKVHHFFVVVVILSFDHKGSLKDFVYSVDYNLKTTETSH